MELVCTTQRPQMHNQHFIPYFSTFKPPTEPIFLLEKENKSIKNVLLRKIFQRFAAVRIKFIIIS